MLADMATGAIVENRGLRRVAFVRSGSGMCRTLGYEGVSRKRYKASFVPEQAGGVLSSAAVPRCGLGPLPPP
jgi:hypothetical protein